LDICARISDDDKRKWIETSMMLQVGAPEGAARGELWATGLLGTGSRLKHTAIILLVGAFRGSCRCPSLLLPSIPFTLGLVR
jgi:hypothetical protein